jgi:DNA-binding transcriptional ArsR family regulator
MIELRLLQPEVKTLGEHLREATELLQALSDPARQDLVLLLARNELNVSELAARLEGKLSRPTVSHHLGVLRRAGLVRARKVGREVYYTLAKERIAAALQSLLDCLLCC